MDQKKFTKTAIILVAAVWIFCGTFMISAKIIKDNKSSTTQPQIQTTAPLSTQPPATTTTSPSVTVSISATTGQFTIGGNNVTTTATVGDPQWLIDQQSSIEASKKAEEEAKNTTESIVPIGKENIVKAYVDGINKLKDTKNMSVSKSPTLEVTIDSVTGGSMVKPFVQNILDSNRPVEATYNFVEGVDQTTGETPITAIAPLGSYAKLDAKAVKSATAERTVGGGFKVTIALVDETQTHETAAPNHSTTVEIIDIDSLMPSGASLNDLDILYSGTVIEAIFDSEKKITSIKHKLPVTKGTGSGSMNVPFVGDITADMEMHGEYNCSYTIKY